MITNNVPSESDDDPGHDGVRLRKDPPSGTIIIDRSSHRNALSRSTVMQLIQAFGDFHQEKSISAVILTGGGDTFSSGTDLQEMLHLSKENDSGDLWREAADDYCQLLETMLRFPKPIIAAVNGPALGSGAGLVLAADIVIGGHLASIGWPEARRGLVASLSAPLLAHRVGTGQASRLLLTGEPIDCDEACQLNLIHEKVDNDLVWARAFEIAERCAECAESSIQLTKNMLNETLGESLFTFHSIGAANTTAVRTTDSAAEGVQAFLEKRDPDWQHPKGWTDTES